VSFRGGKRAHTRAPRVTLSARAFPRACGLTNPFSPAQSVSVAPFRDYFLRDPPPYNNARSPLVHAFANLIRRVWSRSALRATVTPQCFVNAVSEASGRKYGPNMAVDAAEFLAWLLNSLHRSLIECGAPVELGAGGGGAAGGGASSGAAAGPQPGGKRAREEQPAPPPSRLLSPAAFAGGVSIVSHVFAGEVEVSVLQSTSAEKGGPAAPGGGAVRGVVQRVADLGGDASDSDAMSDGEGRGGAAAPAAPPPAPLPAALAAPASTVQPFLFLSLDLPPAPLFRDSSGGLSIPQVPVYALLSRFDGVTVTETLRGQFRERRRFRILRLPRFLVLVFKRFSRNAYSTEKNPTIVTFPTRNLELRPYVAREAAADAAATSQAVLARCSAGPAWPSPDAVAALSVANLKALLARAGVPLRAADLAGLERADLVARAVAAVAAAAAAPAPLFPPAAFSIVSKYDLVASVVHEVAANTASGVAGSGAGVKAASGATSSSGTSAMAARAARAAASAATASGGAAAADGAAVAVRANLADADPLLRGSYRVHLAGPTAAAQQWYEISDERVRDVLAQQVGVSEACMLVFARRETDAALQSALADEAAPRDPPL
jgi:hypothetical protein